MALRYAPAQGTVVTVNFDEGFKPPEMVKRRLAVILSLPIKARGGLVTVVPLSTTAPKPPMPWHCEIDLPFELPSYWGSRPRWVKGDMINAVGFHRVDLLSLGKASDGRRIYQTGTIPRDMLTRIQVCVLRSLGLRS